MAGGGQAGERVPYVKLIWKDVWTCFGPGKGRAAVRLGMVRCVWRDWKSFGRQEECC